MKSAFAIAMFATLFAASLAHAAGNEPSRTRWETRSAGKLKVAVVAGPGAVQTVSLMCRDGAPVIALVLKDGQPASQPALLSMTFGVVRIDLPLNRSADRGNIWHGDLRASPLPKLLASESGEVAVALNGEAQGALTLQGSTQASRTALGGCYRY